MMTARLDDSLKNLNHGWTTSEKDMVIRYHISNQFLEPTQLDGRNSMRTTLVQSADGGWSMAEYCADMTKLVVLDAAFGEKAMRPVITILTCDSMVPENMGFILEDEFDFNPQQRNDEAEAAAIPVAPDENEMEQRRDEDGERRNDRIGDMVVEKAEEKKDALDKIAVAPFDPQAVVVNGIELTSESSLATLPAAVSFYAKSTSGGKL